MTIKLTRYALSLLILTTAAIAQEPTAFNEQEVNYTEPASLDNYIATQAPVPPKYNLYLGILGGGDVGNFKFKNQPNVTTTIPNYSTSSFRLLGHGGIFGGFGRNYGNFYLGGEIGLNYNPLYKNETMFPTKSTSSNSNVSISYRQLATGSISIMPGYLTTDQKFLFYVDGGLALSYSQLKLLGNYSNNPNASFVDSTTKFLSGFRGGIGMDYFPSESFSIRTEYVYNIYSTFSSNHNATPAFGDVTRFSYSVKPTVHQVNIGFAYHF